MYPIKPTKFENNYKQEWYQRDFFYSPDGVKEFPNHHCKDAWILSVPFITKFRNAVDVGCRDGEYTRYLSNTFAHTYCFDDRIRSNFSYNCDQNKVTHFACLVGNKRKTKRLRDFRQEDEEKRGDFYALDEFGFKNVDYIKIDTDGYEMGVILGAEKLIAEFSPIIMLEVFFERDTLKYCIDKLGYKHVATCSRGWDHVLVRE